MRFLRGTPCLLSVLVAGCSATGSDDEQTRSDPWLTLVGTIPTSSGAAEDLSLREEDRLLLVSLTETGTVDLFELGDPAAPTLRDTFDLHLLDGEELTSIALHPAWDYFVAAVRAAGPLERGRLAFYRLSNGEKLGDLEVGVQPDCVRIDPTGRNAIVANEAESWVPDGDGFRSGLGSLSLVELGPDPTMARARDIRLPDFTGLAGAVETGHGRYLEREIEGEERLLPLGSNAAEFVEPEYIAFDSSGQRAFVTLQENNAVVVVATRTGRILAVHGLGTTEHTADVEDDGTYIPATRIRALREPDGIAVTVDDRYFVTADEGDTAPDANELEAGAPAGGGRTVSVFDASTGECLGDTGQQLDEFAASAGIYPDGRSDNKGSEPEIVVCFSIEGRSFAAVGLERASGVALVDLSDPRTPRVVATASLGTEEPHAPEALVHFRDPGSGLNYVYTANEVSGTLGVLRIDL